MVRRIGGRGRRPNHIDPARPGALEYFEEKIGQFLGRRENYYERAEFLAKSGMREDRNKADCASTFNANIGLAINYFIEYDGNIDDAYEIILSHVSERAFKKFALRKYYLIDPLNPPTVGSAPKPTATS